MLQYQIYIIYMDLLLQFTFPNPYLLTMSFRLKNLTKHKCDTPARCFNLNISSKYEDALWEPIKQQTKKSAFPR